MTIKQITVESPLLKVGCTLGEGARCARKPVRAPIKMPAGPLYDPVTSVLHFVDIAEKRVYHLHTDTLALQFDQYDEAITCLALREDGAGLAGMTAKGFALLRKGSAPEYLSRPLEGEQHTRFNDGGCDARGRFIAGTIYSKDHGIPGQLYRYDPHDGSCEIIDKGPFTDSNGLGWSPDGKILYFTDSLVNKIYAYDYDHEDGKLSNRRTFVDAAELGFPHQSFCDGLCVDDAGGVWSARWGGSRIVRFGASGTVDLEILVPSALHVTACCFGGSKGDQLYVTTAHCGANGGDATRQEQFPDSGHLFVVDLSGKYRGVKRHHFGTK